MNTRLFDIIAMSHNTYFTTFNQWGRSAASLKLRLLNLARPPPRSAQSSHFLSLKFPLFVFFTLPRHSLAFPSFVIHRIFYSPPHPNKTRTKQGTKKPKNRYFNHPSIHYIFSKNSKRRQKNRRLPLLSKQRKRPTHGYKITAITEYNGVKKIIKHKLYIFYHR